MQGRLRNGAVEKKGELDAVRAENLRGNTSVMAIDQPLECKRRECGSETPWQRERGLIAMLVGARGASLLRRRSSESS